MIKQLKLKDIHSTPKKKSSLKNELLLESKIDNNNLNDKIYNSGIILYSLSQIRILSDKQYSLKNFSLLGSICQYQQQQQYTRKFKTTIKQQLDIHENHHIEDYNQNHQQQRHLMFAEEENAFDLFESQKDMHVVEGDKLNEQSLSFKQKNREKISKYKICTSIVLSRRSTLKLELVDRVTQQCKFFCEFPLQKFLDFPDNRHQLDIDLIPQKTEDNGLKGNEIVQLKMNLYFKHDNIGYLSIQKVVTVMIEPLQIEKIDPIIIIHLDQNTHQSINYKLIGEKLIWRTNLSLQLKQVPKLFQIKLFDNQKDCVIGEKSMQIIQFMSSSKKAKLSVKKYQLKLKDKLVGQVSIYYKFQICA